MSVLVGMWWRLAIRRSLRQKRAAGAAAACGLWRRGCAEHHACRDRVVPLVISTLGRGRDGNVTVVVIHMPGDGGFRSPLRTACVVVHQSDGKGVKAASDGGWLLAWGVALWEVSLRRRNAFVWQFGGWVMCSRGPLKVPAARLPARFRDSKPRSFSIILGMQAKPLDIVSRTVDIAK